MPKIYNWNYIRPSIYWKVFIGDLWIYAFPLLSITCSLMAKAWPGKAGPWLNTPSKAATSSSATKGAFYSTYWPWTYWTLSEQNLLNLNWTYWNLLNLIQLIGPDSTWLEFIGPYWNLLTLLTLIRLYWLWLKLIRPYWSWLKLISPY